MIDYTFNTLNRGIFIRLFYTDKNNVIKFALLMKGEFLNKIYPHLNLKFDVIYDVVKKQPFDFNQIIVVNVIELPVFIENVDQTKIFEETSIVFDEEYGKKCKEHIKEVVSFLKNKYLNLLNFESDEYYRSEDAYILRFYPDIIPNNKKSMKTLIKEDVYEKYFVANFQNDNYHLNLKDNISLIIPFAMFGILQKNEKCTDDVFISALKRMWFNLIEKAKDDLITSCEEVLKMVTKKEEIKEFEKEFKQLKRELNNIQIDVLKDFKTPIEVVSYWPNLLQPAPDYVYDDQFFMDR